MRTAIVIPKPLVRGRVLDRVGPAIAGFVAGLLCATMASVVIERAFVRPILAEAAPLYYVTSAGTIEAIFKVDPQTARTIFCSPSSVALESPTGGIDPCSQAIAGRSWASYAEFKRDLAAGTVPGNVWVVMYDPERWDATPLVEQRHPAIYMHRFVVLAQEKGYFAMVTPNPGLVEVPGGDCVRAPGETEEAAYLRCGIAAMAARGADAVETQAQSLERDPQAYRAFVLATAQQARAVNPDVILLSGLSTSPGYPATPSMLYDAAKSVQGIVDGFYLSLAHGRYADRAASFLRMESAPRA